MIPGSAEPPFPQLTSAQLKLILQWTVCVVTLLVVNTADSLSLLNCEFSFKTLLERKRLRLNVTVLDVALN